MDNYEKLVKLADKKEYRVVIKKELEYVLQSNLSDGAKLCWMHLRFESYFTDGKISFSNITISKGLNKSIPSVARYIGELKKAGFLEVNTKNVYSSHSSRVLQVTFPDEGITRIASEKDRTVRKCETSGTQKTISLSNLIGGHIKIDKHTINNTIKNNTYYPNQKSNAYSILASDKQALLKETKKIEDLEESLKSLRRQFIDENTKSKYDITRKIGDLESELKHRKDKTSRLKNIVLDKRQSEQFNRMVLSNSKLLNDIPGERRLNDFQIRKIKNCIQKNIQPEVRNTLVNDLIFNIRFGRLSGKSYITNRRINIDFAINAGLKLIKSGKYVQTSMDVVRKKLKTIALLPGSYVVEDANV